MVPMIFQYFKPFYKLGEIMAFHDLFILYGSQTGNAENIAEVFLTSQTFHFYSVDNRP